VDDAERQRHERRLARDRRRRDQGKPTYFESEATLDSWPVAQDPSELSTTILRPRRDPRGELVGLEAAAIDQEGAAMEVAAPAPAAERPDTTGNLTRSGVIFAVATGLSRLIGLIREIVQAALFGISGPVNAFEIAFLIPNTVRSLVADSALSAAFVPVFSDLLVKGERKRAWRVASSWGSEASPRCSSWSRRGSWRSSATGRATSSARLRLGSHGCSFRSCSYSD
jgi:hypothetical protein